VRRIRIVLADDHVIVLDGLEQLFRLEPELEVVARSTTAEAAVKAVQEHRPDVLVLDLVMPGHDGMWVLRELSELNLPTRTVLLTAHVEENRLVEAIRLGVWGIVLKEMAPRMLMECVRKVHAGEQWLEKRSVAAALESLMRRERGARNDNYSRVPEPVADAVKAACGTLLVDSPTAAALRASSVASGGSVQRS